MMSAREVLNQSNRVAVQFLLADLRTAFTFLDTAEVTSLEETRIRNQAHARRVYETILRFLRKVAPLPEEATELKAGIAELKKRLEEVGYSLPSE